MKKAKRKKVIKMVAPVCVAGMMISPSVFAASTQSHSQAPSVHSVLAQVNKGNVTRATGSGLSKLPEPKGPFYNIVDFGASPTANGVQNQQAIDAAIAAANAAGGGTVVIPSGDFKTYTIHLKSNVGIHFMAKDSIIRAAVPVTDGGYYDAPEASPWIGLEDEGHAHFANSLIYGKDIQNVMISGPGLIDGAYIDKATGNEVPVLLRSDIPEATSRTEAGVPGTANKAIAIIGGKNIIMRDFNMRYGGHFAIYGNDITNWTLDNMIVDTNRDGIDIDESQNVTIRNSTYNTVNDDAIVLKSTFSNGKITKTKNVLVQNNKVMGYDTGSVLDGTYSKASSTQATGRIKLGTEATGGFDTVTVTGNYFEHCRGFAIEEVDGAKTSNVIFENSTMKDIVNSPVYIRLGDRDRTPVTGNNADESINQPNNVRLDNGIFTLPNLIDKYGYYPAQRYAPSYNYTAKSTIGGGSTVNTVDPTNPTKLNPNSIKPNDPLYANAIGAKNYSSLENVSIKNIKVTDADPRFPMQIDGLVDHPIKNVTMNNVDVQYRGGLSLQDAVEQRQLNTTSSVHQYLLPASNSNIRWFVAGSASNEELLPHIAWNPNTNAWVNSPYNLAEGTRDYPEPEDFGVLPAYGMYVRHVEGLNVNNMKVGYDVKDTRPAFVLDDVTNGSFNSVKAPTEQGVPQFVKVTDTMKRTALDEFVKDFPYETTTVANVSLPKSSSIQNVTINVPSPGTPNDDLYPYPTAPDAAHPYSYDVPNSSKTLPATINRPFFEGIGTQTAKVGQTLQFTMHGVDYLPGATLTYSVSKLPSGATFDPATQVFTWTPKTAQAGTYHVTFTLNDGVLPETRTVDINVVK